MGGRARQVAGTASTGSSGMNTGESFNDSRGQKWTVGQQLGRGLWGSSWLVRNGSDQEMVLKIAHQTSDFPTDAPLPAHIVEDCRTCLHEQATLLREASFPFLLRLDQVIKLPTGSPALLLPKYTSMEKANLSLRHSLELLAAVTRTLRNAGRIQGPRRYAGGKGRPDVHSPL